MEGLWSIGNDLTVELSFCNAEVDGELRASDDVVGEIMLSR